MSQTRPKPWETNTQIPVSDTPVTSAATNTASTTPAVTTSSLPELPPKPSALTNQNASTSMNTTALPTSSTYPSNYNSLGSYGSGYGTSGYGGYSSGYGTGLNSYGSYGSGYGSGYNRYGGMGMSSMYGMGSMGGMGMYGMGGMNGMNMDNNSFSSNTQATFQLIESVIGAVAGFAQMLESTYYATHNSFFTMVGVAEQFSHLKDALGGVLGIYAIIAWIKKLLSKLRGGIKGKELVGEFIEWKKDDKNKTNSKKSISLKPLVLFLSALIGLPLLLNKLIKYLSIQQQRQQQQNQQYISNPLQNENQNQNQKLKPQQIDPKQLEFARALYSFHPENEIELKLEKGDLMAILSKADEHGEESKWWKCRSRDGRIGFVPYNYVEIIKKIQ